MWLLAEVARPVSRGAEAAVLPSGTRTSRSVKFCGIQCMYHGKLLVPHWKSHHLNRNGHSTSHLLEVRDWL